MEVTSLLSICYELNLIEANDYENLRKDIELITNKLNALRNYHMKNN